MAAAQKTAKRLGGMAEALAIAADLGFPAPPAQQEDQGSSDKSDDLVRVLRELTVVQRNIANLQVELQGRKDDKNIAHLTHDRIIARLQQPYSLDCIPVEAEYQKQFSELLLKAASDYGALTASVGDFQWSQNFRESPAVWGEMLRPIPAALASCTRFFEAMSAMRESFSTLQKLRVGHSSLSMTPSSSSDDSKFLTPPQWREGSMLDSWKKVEDINPENDGLDGINQRRLSWPSSIKRDQ
ncbi:hypothetical protein GUJ93_ZPchr0010g8217 [Zizania palustris]|uniref:AUGMIN subunit 2 n=1 Tax=Zizania palustris TaxID=103762 RepID=A0A8J6BN36_ZIZPA|nr:hypothetical protein GUJ93_ZPchr0010g8217 [Zizania palustris]